MGEIKNQIDGLIDNCTDFSFDEKKVWKKILSQITDFQEEIIQDVAKIVAGKSDDLDSNWKIECGITNLDENKIGENKRFVSVSDDINSRYFPSGYSNESESKKDGDWSILGTAYMDYEYEDMLGLCGRTVTYTGKTDSGKIFTYSLVLNNNILSQEKELHRIAAICNVPMSVMYAPMLRRLVYIESQSEISEALFEHNFCFEENNLYKLKYGWRAFWNIDISNRPYGVRNADRYKFKLGENEYIIPEGKYCSRLKIEKEYDVEKDCNLIFVSSEDAEDPRDYLNLVKLLKLSNQENIRNQNTIAFYTNGINDVGVKHIYSMSDIFKIMDMFSDYAVLYNVHTKYPVGMKVCSYEFGFQYPENLEYFTELQRPKLFLEFKNDGSMFLFDRIVYVMSELQRYYPEYIWKGGYFE